VGVLACGPNWPLVCAVWHHQALFTTFLSAVFGLEQLRGVGPNLDTFDIGLARPNRMASSCLEVCEYCLRQYLVGFPHLSPRCGSVGTVLQQLRELTKASAHQRKSECSKSKRDLDSPTMGLAEIQPAANL
jgi:hypothetical protein